MGRSPTGRSTWPWRSPLRAPATFWALWAGDGGEGAKFWLQVLTELKNRGVADVCIAVCDGLELVLAGCGVEPSDPTHDQPGGNLPVEAAGGERGVAGSGDLSVGDPPLLGLVPDRLRV